MKVQKLNSGGGVILTSSQFISGYFIHLKV
jgi:hypothetical protein